MHFCPKTFMFVSFSTSFSSNCRILSNSFLLLPRRSEHLLSENEIYGIKRVQPASFHLRLITTRDLHVDIKDECPQD